VPAPSQGTLSPMVLSEPTSAIIVRVPIPARVARVRRRWDRSAAIGVPPHVTVLFPFLAPGRLDAAVRHDLADIAAAHDAFDVRFATVGRFPGLLYLAPEPADPFVALTEACVERFPDFPPYEGLHDDIVPHLTVVEGDEAPMDEIAIELEAEPPFDRRVRAIEVITPSETGPWRVRWRLPLGQRGGTVRP
jgi:2'-5' RNA ligase